MSSLIAQKGHVEKEGLVQDAVARGSNSVARADEWAERACVDAPVLTRRMENSANEVSAV